MKSQRARLLQLGRRSLEALVDFVLELLKELHALRRRVRQLEQRQAQNSTNSNKPPSTDGLTKPAPKSLRQKTGRKPGGQPGHPGHTLQPVKKPNHTVVHRLERCPCGRCGGRSLKDEPVLDYQRRQVFDLPPKSLEVTEHQAECKRCPVSGQMVWAEFPPAVQAPVQYGPRFLSLMVYLNQQHFIPYERLRQLCQDLYNQPLSRATLVAANQRAYEQLEGFEQALKERLVQVEALHTDESGLRVNGRLQWLHVLCTKHLTFYGVHPKRGAEAVEAFDIIPRYKNWLIHDHWKSYFRYEQCLHGLCNEHHLRELKFLWEEEGETWAKAMSDFLVASDQERQERGPFDEAQFKAATRCYRAILRLGRQSHPRPGADQGRSAQCKAANLLDRLEDYEDCVLAFLWDEHVPFTNNQAEQDIRMVKVRQKISGCFRTGQGAKVFCRIRSYISTCRKQTRNICTAIEHAILGNPFLPSAPTRGP